MYIARLPIWLVRFKNAIDIAGLLLGKEAITTFFKTNGCPADVSWITSSRHTQCKRHVHCSPRKRTQRCEWPNSDISHLVRSHVRIALPSDSPLARV